MKKVVIRVNENDPFILVVENYDKDGGNGYFPFDTAIRQVWNRMKKGNPQEEFVKGLKERGYDCEIEPCEDFYQFD